MVGIDVHSASKETLDALAEAFPWAVNKYQGEWFTVQIKTKDARITYFSKHKYGT